MKKLLMVLAVLFVAVAAIAQPKVNYTFANDTLTNSETVYLTYPKAINTDAIIAFGFTLTEVSGSATIVATLQESVQSGKWVDVAVGDTLVTSGSPNEVSHIFKLVNTPSLNYRVKLAQTGTAVTKVLASKFIAK